MAIVTSNKKRGQTIIEVLMAITMLAFVLAGSLTLIIKVVGLVLESRTMTQVVTYAQSGLSKVVVGAEGGCLIKESGRPAQSVLDNPNDGAWSSYGPGSNIKRISWTEDSSVSINGVSGFLVANVTVNWSDKGGTKRSYSLQQLIINSGGSL